MKREDIKTSEDLFDYIRGFMLEQGEPSVDENGRCAYRGQEGRACAVGCTLTDEEYKETFENDTIGTLISHRTSEFPDRLTKFPDELFFAQSCHDVFCAWRSFNWKYLWTKVFTEENLETFLSFQKSRYRFFYKYEGKS